ncbi:MAG: ribonuclease III [Synergistaceae bacterium]|nr:ribonuclease III [Synergistaceae bacterium]
MKNDMGREEQLCALQEKLHYRFSDRGLLEEALTHASYANENGVKFNERLEFLGDAVLELISSARLFVSCPDCNEGQLTRLRAQLVCKNSLSEWAAENGLKELIRTGRSLAKSGPTDSIAADCVEALFGAVFMDGGYEAAVETVNRFLDSKAEMSGAPMKKDPKTELQEYFQSRGVGTPVYKTIERSGPEHASRFKVRLTDMNGKLLAEAWGLSTKEAEFSAAEAALKKLAED